MQSKAYDGITTRAVFKMVMWMLDERERSSASRYDLKGAIMRLGPSGFPFETFIAEILGEKYINMIKRAKRTRETAQYSVEESFGRKEAEKMISMATECVNRIDEMLSE